MGDRSFFCILRRYAADLRHASATTDDFIAIAEGVTSRDLTAFFDAWLYQEAVPETPGLGIGSAT